MSYAKFPDRVKVRRLAFAEFKCEGIVTRDDGTKVRCNAVLARTRVHYDHDNPDGLTGLPTFENCRALCRQCHADKTPIDQANIARAKRREAAAAGATRPAETIDSPGFPPSDKPKRASREPVAGMTGIARRIREVAKQ